MAALTKKKTNDINGVLASGITWQKKADDKWVAHHDGMIMTITRKTVGTYVWSIQNKQNFPIPAASGTLSATAWWYAADAVKAAMMKL